MQGLCEDTAAHPCRAHAKSSVAASFSQSVGLQQLGSSSLGSCTRAVATSASGHDESKAQQPEKSTDNQPSSLTTAL